MNTKRTEISPVNINNSQAQSFFEIIFISQMFITLSPLCQLDFRNPKINHWIGILKLLWQNFDANTIHPTANNCQSLGINGENLWVDDDRWPSNDLDPQLPK